MQGDNEQLLSAARQLYYAGKLGEAERELQKLIAVDPGRADAWFVLGMIRRSLGRHEEGVEACRTAVRLDANHAAAHNMLGILLAETGKTSEAIDAFKHSLGLSPNKADTHFNLGLALVRENRAAEAVEAWRSAITLQPAHPGAQGMLRKLAQAETETPSGLATTQAVVDAGVRLQASVPVRNERIEAQLAVAGEAFERGDFAAAEAACRQAAEQNPDHPRMLQYLGNVLLFEGRTQEALRELERAVQLQPDDGHNHYSLACALATLDHHPKAVTHFREALRLEPDSPLAHLELGKALAAHQLYGEAEPHLRRAASMLLTRATAQYELASLLLKTNRLVEAEAAARRAIELQPDDLNAWNALGGALAAQGRLDAAEPCYERALQIDPGNCVARASRAMIWMAQGRWQDAWPDHEYRFHCRSFKCRRVEGRPWRGEPLNGARTLLFADQALGDTLHCVRYAPLVTKRGGHVLLAVQAPLLPLLRRLEGVEQFIDVAAPLPQFDVQAAIMSLPYLFGTTPATVPADVPYLSADPELVRSWGDELETIQGLKIGVAWQGNPDHVPGLNRSIPLAAFEPLARLPGVRLISLQKGPGDEQIAQVPFGNEILDLSSRLDELSGAFMDTAAIMHQLDLVISCDTSVAHLAGALAVPVWVALPAVADWRWLLDRDDTPWYPTMRLFRQREPGNWDEVFQRIAEALRHRKARGADERLKTCRR